LLLRDIGSGAKNKSEANRVSAAGVKLDLAESSEAAKATQDQQKPADFR
jgi:hypothetical protein